MTDEELQARVDALFSGKVPSKAQPSEWDRDIARLKEIRARREKITGFEHRTSPGVLSDYQGLAELARDGKWKYWDMRTVFSQEACDFIAHSPDDMMFLLNLLKKYGPAWLWERADSE